MLLAAAPLAVFTGLTFVSGSLPGFAPRADGIVSVAVGVALVALAVGLLLPLRVLGSRILIVAAVALPLSAVFSLTGVVPVANLCKVAGATALGFWIAVQLFELAGPTTGLSLVVAIAVVIPCIDIYSVFAGPTKAIVTRAPAALGYLTVAFPVAGYHCRDAYALGVSDIIFFALFLASAAVFGLRVRATAAAMSASFVATVAATLWWQALPALPLLSVAFLAVNADLIWRGVVRPARAG